MATGDNDVNLPPGFRFSPSDEELVVHFLQRKASLLPCHPNIIPDLDLYPYDPWDLDGKAMEEGKRWYFYSRRTETRITSSGFWNLIGEEEPILSSKSGNSKRKLIGIKKYYVFYVGEPNSEGIKTNWILQEFSLCDQCGSSARRKLKNDYSKWVLCRVYEHKSYGDGDDDEPELSCLDELFLSIDDDCDEICS